MNGKKWLHSGIFLIRLRLLLCVNVLIKHSGTCNASCFVLLWVLFPDQVLVTFALIMLCSIMLTEEKISLGSVSKDSNCLYAAWLFYARIANFQVSWQNWDFVSGERKMKARTKDNGLLCNVIIRYLFCTTFNASVFCQSLVNIYSIRQYAVLRFIHSIHSFLTCSCVFLFLWIGPCIIFYYLPTQ